MFGKQGVRLFAFGDRGEVVGCQGAVGEGRPFKQWFKYYKTMSFSSWFYDIGTIV